MRTLIGFVVFALFAPSLVWGKIGGGDIVLHPSGAGNVTYSHDVHVGKFGLKCRECHPALFKMANGFGTATMADMESGKACGACHNGKRAFAVKENCAKCHQ